jgi:hypothetical protein
MSVERVDARAVAISITPFMVYSIARRTNDREETCLTPVYSYAKKGSCSVSTELTGLGCKVSVVNYVPHRPNMKSQIYRSLCGQPQPSRRGSITL